MLIVLFFPPTYLSIPLSEIVCADSPPTSNSFSFSFLHRILKLSN